MIFIIPDTFVLPLKHSLERFTYFFGFVCPTVGTSGFVYCAAWNFLNCLMKFSCSILVFDPILPGKYDVHCSIVL